jgi:NAD(P)-dependent dehydrogenase (short-subunit alcohol dehydrogenase family)
MKDGVVIVTGAASGIGRATALAFARAGAKLSLSDVNESGGADTLNAVRAAGVEAIFTRCDVTDERSVGAMVNATVERFGRLDGAFNNAGIENDPKPIADIDAATFDRVIATNVRGVYLCMKAEIPVMVRQGKGAIVNTASVAGLVGAPGLTPYVASKHAVVGLTKSASAEYARMGLRINAICPGLIETPMLDRLVSTMGRDAFEMYVTQTPIGRTASPDEIAAAVVWLCSDAASFVTGFPMAVDGGLISV